MSSTEPGLDRHEWETEWEDLQAELAASPGEALPALDDLITRMLAARGLAVDEEVAGDGIEPQVLAEYRSVHEVALRLGTAEQVDPGDVASAVNGLTALYETLIVERPAP
jgi:hypothetical protein